MSLGPVTVTRIWAAQGSGAKANRFMLIEDPSGKGALKIWGPAASTAIAEGDSLVLTAQGPQGSLQNQEYQQKWSINANSCRVAVNGAAPPAGQSSGGGQAAPPQQRQQPQGGGGGSQQQPPPPNGTGITTEEICSRSAQLASTMLRECEAIGLPPEISNQLAINAPQTGALWWFGQKHPGMYAGE